MKMANGVLLKKFAVQAVIDPGRLVAIEFGKEIENEKERYLKNLKKLKNFEEIYIGQIVAVKYENEFYIGIITDIYNRQFITIYSVWLINNCTNIEASSDSIFLIRTSKRLAIKYNTFEIIVHGIRPLTIELLVGYINLDSQMNINTLDSILRKRESNKWSPAAFNFIKDLFKTIKYIYVRCIEVSGSTITGDVYFEQDDDFKLTSLAQILCARNFAVFNQKESLPIDNKSGDCLNIEKRIPDILKKVEREELSVVNVKQKKNLNSMSFGNTSSYSESDKSSFLDSDTFLKNLEDKTKPSVTNKNFSSSWILKKMAKISPSVSSESSKRSFPLIEESNRTEQTPKISLFRIVQRNIKLNNL